jgi:hypothetical protein
MEAASASRIAGKVISHGDDALAVGGDSAEVIAESAGLR